MLEDTLLPFPLLSVQRKKVTAAFDGGRMTSDGGVMLLASIETSLGIAARLAPLIADPRNPAFVTHSVADILRARMLAIACGYEDGDDLDHLRTDPGFKLACGRLPDSGTDLCSQPTVSRWENAPDLREVIRLTYAMVDLYCASYPRPPRAVTLTSMTPSTSCMDTNNSRCSTRITTSAASCRSMSTTLRHRVPWRCCCDPAQRRPAQNPQLSAPPGPPHSAALAGYAADHSRRRSLRPSRGDGVVRGPWCGLHSRLAGQRCSTAWRSRMPTM